jgi:hypothetical protein
MKDIFEEKNKFMKLFLALLLFSKSVFSWALAPSDFQLIQVQDPPYFASNYAYCPYHLLNSPVSMKKKSPPYPYSFPYENIRSLSLNALKNALVVCRYQNLPPPFFWVDENATYWRGQCMGNFLNSFFNRYPNNFRTPRGWPPYDAVEYSEYVQKYSYLYYWFALSYDLIMSKLTRSLREQENQLREFEEKGWGTHSLEEEIDKLTEAIATIPSCQKQSIEYLYKTFEEITDHFLLIYEECIQEDKNPAAIYQRGKIYFDRGETSAFVSDIIELIELGYTQTPEMRLDLGKAYNDANLYNHAIQILSETIQKNPHLKEAYFERAIAYFETGNFQLALSDYLSYGTRPTCLNDRDYQHFVFSVGLGAGCIMGGIDSAIHFFPNLFSTIYGIGKGIWTLAKDPIGVTKEFAEGAIASVEYIKKNLNAELLASLVPELKECIEKWDQLDEEKKGYYVGYVVSHYGIDALIAGKTARAIQIYRNLKTANAALTFETALASPANAEALAKASEDFFKWRNDYKKKCWLHMGQQEKHIPGANNFEVGKGELTISVEHLEKLVYSKLGEGVPSRFSFGTPGYKEIVEFDEIIGVHVDRSSKARINTSVGEIHYNKNGGYHVVPVEPNKIKRLLGKKNE